MQRGARGSGISVDPVRVRGARVDAGLTLAQVAGDDVSRTFIHLVENGRSRPSRQVLDLIARRTGKPVSYFIQSTAEEASSNSELVDDLTQMAARIRHFSGSNQLTKVERQAMRMVEMSLRQGAALARTVTRRPE